MEDVTYQTGKDTKCKIQRPTPFRADSYDERMLPCPSVVVNITVIVDNQQGVYDQSAGNGSE